MRALQRRFGFSGQHASAAENELLACLAADALTEVVRDPTLSSGSAKKALIVGHDEGGENLGQPFAFLKASLKAIAAGHPADRTDELMLCKPLTSLLAWWRSFSRLPMCA